MNLNSSKNFLRDCARVMFLGLLAFLPATFTAAQTNEARRMPPPAPRRPSIILILADNIGYGDLGCYGQTKIKTPNLDRLAKQGVRFTSFYVGSPQDAPARAALLTGFEPRHLHAGFNETLPAEALTIAALLKQHGYHTGLIGEWGLGDTGAETPQKKGFDEFAGFLNAAHAQNYFSDRIWRHDPTHGDAQMIFPENENGWHGQFLPDLLTTAAMNFVRLNKPEPLNLYRPFFLCLAYPIPHVSPDAAPNSSEYADAPWPPLERIRATLVSKMDDGIGQLMNKLAELKMDTNTVIVFTSIGGPENDKNKLSEFFNSAGSLRGGQGSLNEGGLRVPLIVRWPAQMSGGGVIDLPCAAWDFFPTAAQIAFIAPPKSDGISFMPALVGQAQTNRHEFLYWDAQENGSFKQAVRMGDWKAVRSETNRPAELFNLKTDPGEKKNVAAKHADTLAKIEKIFQDAHPDAKTH